MTDISYDETAAESFDVDDTSHEAAYSYAEAPQEPSFTDVSAQPQGYRDTRLPTYVGAGISFLWLALCAFYVSENVGWAAIWDFLPNEIGVFLAGVFAPLAFVWLALAYIGRSGDLRRATVYSWSVTALGPEGESLAGSDRVSFVVEIVPRGS